MPPTTFMLVSVSLLALSVESSIPFFEITAAKLNNVGLSTEASKEKTIFQLVSPIIQRYVRSKLERQR